MLVEPAGSIRRSRERGHRSAGSPNKKAFNTAFAGLTLSLYSLKNDFRLYYQSIERRLRGVHIDKRPAINRAFVFLNRIVSTLKGTRKKQVPGRNWLRFVAADDWAMDPARDAIGVA